MTAAGGSSSASGAPTWWGRRSGWCWGVQLVSLFLFVATATHLHTLFTGAMCAVGTLNASRFGWPALAAKVVAFVLCGLWLVVQGATSSASSPGLVRFRNLFVLPVAAALVVENVLQYRYFADLDPEIITSCCATIFSAQAGGVASGLAALPASGVMAAFAAALVLTLGAGFRCVVLSRSPVAYSVFAVPLAGLALAAVISWFAPAVYQLPTHHCPFCLLSSDYGYVGYPVYGLLSLAVVAGGGSGLVHRLRAIDRTGGIGPGEERRLCAVSMAGFALFSLFGLWPILATLIRLGGL